MELLLELFVTAFVAICFSFLVAKLVSIAAMVDDDGLARRDLGLQHSSKIVEEEPLTEDLKFDRGLEVEGTQSKRRVQFVVEEVVGKVDEFEAQGSVDDSTFDEQLLVDKCCEEEELCAASTRIEAEESSDQLSEVVGLSVNSPELVRGFQSEEVNQSIEGGEFCSVREGKIINQLIVDDKIENEQPDDDDDETVEELGTADVGAYQSGDVDDQKSGVKGELNRIDEEKKERLSDDDDDWEGIERSDLEKVFATAANYVAIGGKDDRLSNLESDVQMQFYGLHKVAMEGPCHEAQPMALKLSARAKWNAWQRLGNISPEVAMEQYISLLSNKDPGWMMQGGDSAGDGDSDSSEAAKPEDTQRSCVTERKQEQMPGTEGVLTGGSSSVRIKKDKNY